MPHLKAKGKTLRNQILFSSLWPCKCARGYLSSVKQPKKLSCLLGGHCALALTPHHHHDHNLTTSHDDHHDHHHHHPSPTTTTITTTHVLSWIMYLPTIHVYLQPRNITLFENRVFADAIKMRSHWSRVSSTSRTTYIFVRRGKFEHRNTDTQGRMPHEETGREWSDDSIS